MGPPVREVVIEKSVFDRAVQRGREVQAEVGFFMIGLVRNCRAYVYDIVEFDYEEMTATFIKSGVDRKLRLAGLLPLGLRLLGNMHKHPWGTEPSLLDERMFLRYAEAGGPYAFVIYTVDPVDARAYTVHQGRVIEIRCDVRELEEGEELISFEVNIPLSIRVCIQKDTSAFELRALLSSKLCREVEKQISFPRLFSGVREIEDRLPDGVRNVEVKPLRPVDIEALWARGLYYRMYVEEGMTEEDVEDFLREVFGPDLQTELPSSSGGPVKLIRVFRKGERGEGGVGRPPDEGGDEDLP